MGHYAGEMGYEPPGMKEHRARIKKIKKLLKEALVETDVGTKWSAVRMKLREVNLYVDHVEF